MIKREPNQTSPAFMPLERGPKGKKKKKKQAETACRADYHT